MQNNSKFSLINFNKFLVASLFIINITIIFVLWSDRSYYYISNPFVSGGIYIALGRISGLLGEYFLLMQLVLIGRIRWFEHLFGFDKLNKVHRWIGYSILALLVSHPIFLVVGNSMANRVSPFDQFADYLANKENVILAFIALLILIYIVFLSIVIVKRKLRYETWYFVHLLTYLAIGLALSHQFGTGDLREGAYLYYWYILNFTVFGLVLIYRFLRPLALFARHRFVVDKIIQESSNTWSLYIVGRQMENFKFKSGQYANINILSGDMWYSHPFSFSDNYNGRYIRFTIKNSGDYTSLISNVKPGTRLVVDGPLGMFVDALASRDKFLFIAGGIGITPLLSILKSLAPRNRDIILLYAVRTEGDLVFRNELEELRGQFLNIQVHFILSTPTVGFDSGYIDKEKISRLVPDYNSREVFLCGPSLMMEAINKDLKIIGFSSKYIHYEKFSF